TPAPETAAAGAAVSAIDLAPGQTASLALYALDFTEPWRLDAPGGGRPSRAVERRSLRVEWAGERLLLRFDTPERITLKAARLESLTSSGGGRPGLEIFFGPDPGAVGDAQGVVTFDTLGEGVRAQLTRRLTLASDSATYAVSGGATEAPRFGEAFEVGGDARAQIRVSRLDLGWRAFAGLFGAVWAGALAALAAGLAWRRGSIAGLVVMGVVECLLALRLLFAVEGAYVDWRPDAAAAAPQAMFAFVLVPFILTMAFAPRATLDRRLTLAYVALAAILTALMFMVVRAADPVGLVLSAIGVLAVASRLLPAPAAPEPLVRWFDGALSRCADGLGALRARLLPGGDAPQAAAGRRTTAILLAVVALVVGRVLLALGGVEQRLPFGGAVSLLWTPALLILTAVLLAQRLAAPAGSVASEGRGAVWLWGVVVLLAAVVPWLVADDLGYAIHLLPLVFVAALLAFAEPTAGGRWRKALLAGPAVAIVVALAGIAIAASIRGPEPSDWAAITDSRSPEAHALLQRYAEEEAAALRMGQSLRREIDAPSGSRQAEEMAAAFHHMRAYGSTVWGRGFLSLDTPTELLRYHLDDNVSVVHLISPHGRMAA
ncbi:MAG TPA: hypothetical protein VGB49_08045, partial [Caulobacteraceae bacterium]